MKKYIIAIAISSAALISNAQSNQGVGESGSRPKMNPQEQTDKMAQELGLSGDQKAKVLAINTEAMQKMQALSGNNGDKEAMHAERKKIQQEKENQLKGVLSADQFNKYLAKKEEMKQQREHHN